MEDKAGPTKEAEKGGQMRLRLTKIDEFQFMTCLKHALWGSKSARFGDWREGDYLAVIVDKSLAGLGEIRGKPFVSRERVWDNGLFPHRIRVEFTRVLKPNDRPPILGKVRDVLTELWGPRYGWGILNQQVIESPQADCIIEAFNSRLNQLSDYKENIQSYLLEAKVRRVTAHRAKRKPGRPPKRPKTTKQLELDDEQRISKRDDSAHTRAQSELIALGKVTGCSVWIARNDQRRKYRGRRLYDDCLHRLPKLGLSEEATNRISLIDVIWINQNAPVCAFEIETSTSIYSGLLRMSDLLSVVPALNLRIFIVAPKERQDKVMRELSRPTFRKIGLSEYCRYISTDDLDRLIDRVKGFEGHVQPSILDTVAVGLEEDEDTENP